MNGCFLSDNGTTIFSHVAGGVSKTCVSGERLDEDLHITTETEDEDEG